MPEISKLNGVTTTNISTVSGVAVASVAEINGSPAPVGGTGASSWVAVGDDRRIAHISNSDLLADNDWSDYDGFAGGSSPNPSGGNDHIHVAYGKDGSGNALWVATYATDACELAYKADPTSGPWTGINKDSSNSDLLGRRFAILWGNDVWIAVGKMGNHRIFRSTNGTDWTQIDVSGVSGITTSAVYALASNGTGTWWFAQQNRIYQSTDDGESWALLHTLLDSSNADPGDIRSMAYTNNTLIAGVQNVGEVYTAASSDLTDWSTEFSINSHGGTCFDQQTRMAAANGRVVLVGGQHKTTFDVSGKTVTFDENGVDFSGTSHGTLSAVCTDGSTWVATCFTGDMFYSTDGGDNWTASTQNAGSKDMLDVAPDVYLPL